MAKDSKANENDEVDETEPFENSPSDLDESTHAELLLMYERASESILFAKNIQWRSVGSSLLVFGAIIAIAFFGSSDEFLVNLLGVLTIVLAIGVIFVLIMYQFWQFNEIARIVELEKYFSTLYLKIRDIKSRREGNIHRYTLLLFMCVVVTLGAFVTNVVIARMIQTLGT